MTDQSLQEGLAEFGVRLEWGHRGAAIILADKLAPGAVDGANEYFARLLLTLLRRVRAEASAPRAQAAEQERDALKAEAEGLRLRVGALEEGVREAASVFREYERLHMVKTPPDRAKADRNVRMAVKLEALLAALNNQEAGRG